MAWRPGPKPEQAGRGAGPELWAGSCGSGEETQGSDLRELPQDMKSL